MWEMSRGGGGWGGMEREVNVAKIKVFSLIYIWYFDIEQET